MITAEVEERWLRCTHPHHHHIHITIRQRSTSVVCVCVFIRLITAHDKRQPQVKREEINEWREREREREREEYIKRRQGNERNICSRLTDGKCVFDLA